MSTRAIATSTLWQIASQVITAALSIVTVKLVAIGLTQELAGFYNSSYGFLQLFGIIADFGLYAVAVRELSKADNRPAILGTLIILRACMTLLSVSVALLIVWTVPSWQGTPLPLSVTIASGVVVFSLLAGMMRAVFQVHYRMHYVLVGEVFNRLLAVALIAYPVLVHSVRASNDPFTLYWFVTAGAIGALFYLIFSFINAEHLTPIRWHYDPTLLKKMALAAAPFGVAYFCMALYRQFDTTMIALLRPDFDIQNAYYGFVVRMTDMGFIIPTYLLNSALPLLAERDGRGEETAGLLGKTLLTLLILSSIVFLFAALWARPIVHLLTTPEYLSTATQAGSDSALRLMSIPMFMNGIILFGFYVLLTRHRWQRLVSTLLIGSVISITLSILLIPSRGFMGAVEASVITHVLLACILLPQALSIMPVRLPRIALMQWFAFTALLAGCLWFTLPLLTTDIRTAIALTLAGAVMAALAWGLRLHRTLGTGTAVE